MKKAKLKINYYQGVTLFKKDEVLTFINNYYHRTNVAVFESAKIHRVDVEKNSDIFEIIEEKTAEELATELDYKLNDLLFNKVTKKYGGKIDRFYITKINEKDFLRCITDLNENLPLDEECNITNKVAIYCPTKEDREFIIKQLNWNIRNLSLTDNNKTFIEVNGYKIFTKDYYGINEYLCLNIDEYCKSQGIKPFFIAEDNKNTIEIEIPEGFELHQIKDLGISNSGKYIYKQISFQKKLQTGKINLYIETIPNNINLTYIDEGGNWKGYIKD
jgi:hypothetical protein